MDQSDRHTKYPKEQSPLPWVARVHVSFGTILSLGTNDIFCSSHGCCFACSANDDATELSVWHMFHQDDTSVHGASQQFFAEDFSNDCFSIVSHATRVTFSALRRCARM